MAESRQSRQLKVFISYAREDVAAVRALRDKLLTNDVNVWMDETSLVAGQDWKFEIESALDSSDLIIVCLSKSAVNKTGFVQKEISRALDLVDLRPEGQIFLVPLRLEECDVPRRLSRWQWLDYFSEGAYPALVLALTTRADQLSNIDTGSLAASTTLRRPRPKFVNVFYFPSRQSDARRMKGVFEQDEFVVNLRRAGSDLEGAESMPSYLMGKNAGLMKTVRTIVLNVLGQPLNMRPAQKKWSDDEVLVILTDRSNDA